MGAGQRSDKDMEDKGMETDMGDPAEWGELKEDVSELADEAVSRGRDFLYAAREQAAGYAEDRKDDIAQSVANFANSLRDSTRDFDDRPNIRAVVDSAAEGLDQLAESIQDRSVAEIVGEAEDFMRRHPVGVAAVSVALGFFAARFIKSTARQLREDNASEAHRNEKRLVHREKPRSSKRG